MRDEQELVRQMKQWDERKRDVPDRGNSECKGSEAGDSNMCWRTEEKFSLAGAQNESLFLH